MDQSSCHTEEEEEADVTHSSDTDFQVKGYKFSKPFHLIVSYGEVPGRPEQRLKPLLTVPQPT